MNIKMIAVDMDGTFLSSEKEYNKKRFAAIYQEMKRQQMKFVVASGNQFYQLQSFFPDISEEIAFVAENGAFVVNQGEQLFVGTIAQEIVTHTYEALAQMDSVQVVVCGQQSAYVLSGESPAFYADCAYYFHRLKVVDDYREIDDHIIKFALMLPADEITPALKQLTDFLENKLVPVNSGHGAIDLISPGTHKAHGLELLQATWQISPEEIAVFGDSGNDLEMIKHAKYSYAMKNAAPEIIAAANFVTEFDNDNEGVLVEIERLLQMTTL